MKKKRNSAKYTSSLCRLFSKKDCFNIHWIIPSTSSISFLATGKGRGPCQTGGYWGDLTGQIMATAKPVVVHHLYKFVDTFGGGFFFQYKKVDARYCNTQTFTMSFPTICLFGFSTRLPAASNLSFGVWTQGWQTTWKTTPTLLENIENTWPMLPL